MSHVSSWSEFLRDARNIISQGLIYSFPRRIYIDYLRESLRIFQWELEK